MRGRSQFRGSAGQYYVAYCLTVRNFHAAITLGNVPDVDIVVAKEDGSRLLSVQVKTATWAHRGKRYGYELREWDVGRSSAGRSSENLWYAFVDLQENDAVRNPLVYIVPSLWVGNFVGIDFSRFMYLLRSELWGECEERWDRIRGFLDEDPTTLAWATQIPKEAEQWPWPPLLKS